MQPRQGGAELDADLGFLMDVTLLSLVDESSIVANHAAYNVVMYAARARSPIGIRRVEGALRRMARDPRLAVRGAAAYGGTYLQREEVASEIRDVAAEIDQAMLRETYAVIHHQRKFGELIAQYP